MSLFLTNGTSLAAVSDVCHPESAPAVSCDIACRSMSVKCDVQTSGVKLSILWTLHGDRYFPTALLCQLSEDGSEILIQTE